MSCPGSIFCCLFDRNLLLSLPISITAPAMGPNGMNDFLVTGMGSPRYVARPLVPES